MKKLLILTAVLSLSACACMYDEPVEETRVAYQQAPQTRPENCDYYDGTTCYRYVRRTAEAPVVHYREVPAARYVEAAPAAPSCGCRAQKAQKTSCGGCAPQIRETREPVEVVYKKTTYKTVFQPQTTSSISYERMPYTGQAEVVTREAPVEVVRPAAPVEYYSTVTPEEEILLNVK